MSILSRIARSLLVAGTLTLPAVPAADPLNLPDIGDTSHEVISPGQEIALGTAFMRRLRNTVPFVDDPEINDYLNGLGQKLAAHSDNTGYPFTFFMVRENSINAFAAPGGFIGTHSGLFLAARNESELAAVLAHEIAHVTQRHLARAYDNASRMSLPTAAAILAAILIGTQDSEAGQAALMSVQAGAIQQQIDFTRANEKEADRIGMHALAGAGFDPEGMPGFFQRLQQQTRYYGNSLPPFLSTHPVTSDRIADAMSRIDQLPARKNLDNLNFYLMQAKLKTLLSDDPQQLLNTVRVSQPGNAPAAAQRYAEALALLTAGQPRDAIQLLRPLQRQDPDRIAFRLALSQGYRDNGQLDDSLSLLRDTLALYPENNTIIHALADDLILAGQFSEAEQLLEKQINRQPRAAIELYPLLAKAATGAGHKAAAHQAMAEHYYYQGQTHAAIEQLELALSQPDINFYTTSRLEARLATFKDEALHEREQQP